MCGPSVKAAATLFAKGVVDYALSLHRGSLHLIHALETAAAAADGGSGDTAEWRAFGLVELLTSEGQQVGD